MHESSLVRRWGWESDPSPPSLKEVLFTWGRMLSINTELQAQGCLFFINRANSNPDGPGVSGSARYDKDSFTPILPWLVPVALRHAPCYNAFMSSKLEPKSRIFLGALVLVTAAIAFSGCTESKNENSPRPASGDAVLQERLAKNDAFKSGAESPVPAEARPSFRGLDYYPYNPDLIFTVSLHRYPGPKPVRLATNKGEIRRGLRYGYFEFQVSGQKCQLQVYRLDDVTGSGPNLFIPFRDSTSGSETYGAGRYIDLVENTSGVYELDFNRAYNPYCAYNEEFSCPIPPAENTLKVPIRAGEKKYLSSRKS